MAKRARRVEVFEGRGERVTAAGKPRFYYRVRAGNGRVERGSGGRNGGYARRTIARRAARTAHPDLMVVDC